MPKADFVSGLVFIALGIFMIGEGLSLPGAGGFIEEGGEPGRVPVFLGATIAILALVLLLRAIRRGGHRLSTREPLTAERRSAVIRAATTAIGCAFYAVGLVGHRYFGIALPYAVATFVFMLAFMVISEWDLAPQIGPRRWRFLTTRAPALAGGLSAVFSFVPAAAAPFAWLVFTAAIQAAIITVAVTYVFQDLFYVTLP